MCPSCPGSLAGRGAGSARCCFCNASSGASGSSRAVCTSCREPGAPPCPTAVWLMTASADEDTRTAATPSAAQSESGSASCAVFGPRPLLRSAAGLLTPLARCWTRPRLGRKLRVRTAVRWQGATDVPFLCAPHRHPTAPFSSHPVLARLPARRAARLPCTRSFSNRIPMQVRRRTRLRSDGVSRAVPLALRYAPFRVPRQVLG